MPRDQSSPFNLPDVPEETMNLETQALIANVENNILQLQADSGWDLAKRWMRARSQLLFKNTKSALAGNSLVQVGEKFLVYSEVEGVFEEFIAWIEQNAEGTKQAKEQSSGGPGPADKRGNKSRRA